MVRVDICWVSRFFLAAPMDVFVGFIMVLPNVGVLVRNIFLLGHVLLREENIKKANRDIVETCLWGLLDCVAF